MIQHVYKPTSKGIHPQLHFEYKLRSFVKFAGNNEAALLMLAPLYYCIPLFPTPVVHNRTDPKCHLRLQHGDPCSFSQWWIKCDSSLCGEPVCIAQETQQLITELDHRELSNPDEEPSPQLQVSKLPSPRLL